MERVTLKSELMGRLQHVLSDAKMTNHYIEDGKEVLAHRQLQGVRAKLVNLIEWVHNDLADDTPHQKPESAQKDNYNVVTENTEAE